METFKKKFFFFFKRLIIFYIAGASIVFISMVLQYEFANEIRNNTLPFNFFLPMFPIFTFGFLLAIFLTQIRFKVSWEYLLPLVIFFRSYDRLLNLSFDQDISLLFQGFIYGLVLGGLIKLLRVYFSKLKISGLEKADA
jgi:hypothetical protein